MDPTTIKELAAQISLHLQTPAWVFLLITLLIGMLGSFIGEYVRKRGEHLATKADFQSLLDQLEKNTRLVEEIKSDVAHRDWNERERIGLLRTKIEELVRAALESENYLERVESDCLNGRVNREPAPHDLVEMIADLYLPRLDEAVGHFVSACRKCANRSLQMGNELVHAKDDRVATAAVETYRRDHSKLLDDFFLAKLKLVASARDLLAETYGHTDASVVVTPTAAQVGLGESNG